MNKKYREDAVSNRCNPRIFAMIAKISLGLQKFRNHYENFVFLAKLGNFARIEKFH